MNYEQFCKETRSQKINLAILKAKQKVKIFENAGGDNWTRVTKYFVSNVEGAPFSYDPLTSTLTIESAVDPRTLNIVVTYSFFFSDFPVNQDVEYQARLVDTGSLKLELDSENIGVALESDSSIKLKNTDGFFDSIYSTLIWEGQECEFYSWSPNVPWSERKLTYRGYVDTKGSLSSDVTFNLKDAFVKLRDRIPEISQRLIYGRVKNLDISSQDKVGDGFQLIGAVSGRNDRDLLTGVLSGTAGGNTVAGTGTSFLSQLASGDKLRVVVGILEYSFTVNSVTSNTSLQISGTISVTFAGAEGRNASKLNNIITGSGFLGQLSPDDSLTILGKEYTVQSVDGDVSLTIREQVKDAFTNESAVALPAINYRNKNRVWKVSGHKLASFETEIISVLSQSAFRVQDIGHIQKDDIIKIVNDFYRVDRVSGNLIFINQVAITLLVSGQSIYKPAIQNLNIDGNDFIHGRDYLENNLDDGCVVVLENVAEKNIAQEKVSGVSLIFTNGSREVSALTSTLDLTTILKPRDWIKAFSGTINYYEILAVEPTKLYLRSAYAEASSFTGPALFKGPTYVGDDSIALVECMGKIDNDGIWVKTASDAVLDLCKLINVTNFNLDSFLKAKEDADYVMSIVFPDSVGGKMPLVRDGILSINKSVFGSLYSDNDFKISYSVLNADRDEDIELINDDDRLSFTTATKNQIVGRVVSKYRHEFGTNAFSTYSFENENLAGNKNELNLDLYLFDEKDAKVITQRYAFLRSQAQTTVTIKAKLNLMFKSLNDRIYMNFKKAFQRYGSRGKVCIGLVNMVTKDSNNITVQVNDLGNVFSRVGAIAPSALSEYSNCTDDEISRYGFIVDSDTETVETDSDDTLGTNLIG